MGRFTLSLAAAGKTAGFALVGAAILATAIHIHHGEGPARGEGRPSQAADPLAPALARCQAIGAAAQTDRDCDAAWAQNRLRFFGAGAGAASGPANRPKTVKTDPKER
jgi:conjugative transfer region protein TrbK